MILAYGIWNNLGNFLAPVVLLISERADPYNFKIPILTQWGFLGLMLPIFIWIPETPCELSSFTDIQCQLTFSLLCCSRST